MKIKKLLVLVLALTVIAASLAMPAAADGSDEHSGHSTTTQIRTTYTQSLNSPQHRKVVYRYYYCNDCNVYYYQETVSDTYESHTFSFTNSAGYHVGVYSKHYYIRTYTCTLCNYSYTEKRLIGCTATACIEPS